MAHMKTLLDELDQPLCHNTIGLNRNPLGALSLEAVPPVCPKEGYSPAVQAAIHPFPDRPLTTQAWADQGKKAHAQHRKYATLCVVFLLIGLSASAGGMGFHLPVWLHFPCTIVGFAGAFLNRERAINWKNRIQDLQPFKPTADQVSQWQQAPLACAYLSTHTTGPVPFLIGDVARLNDLVAAHTAAIDTARLTKELENMFPGNAS
jgi:hypothetical protein